MPEPETGRSEPGSDSDNATRDYDASSHEGVQLMASEKVFEPGPSFTDNEAPTDRLAEMPAWLQTFVASQDAPDEALRESPEPVQETVTPFRLVEPDSTLPEWLRAEPAHSAAVTELATLDDFDNFEEPAENGTDTFISEDDLPDWLRAFSHETRDAPEPILASPARAAAQSSVTTNATLVRVPPIENVWLSSDQRQALGPGRTLFALLASNAGTATFAEDNGTNPAADADSGFRSERDASATSAVASAASGGAVSVGTEETPRSSTRLLLLALIVVLLLIFVSFRLLG